MSQGQTANDPATKVQRYGVRELYKDEMGPFDNGEFVRFSDYQALSLREGQLREALQNLVAAFEQYGFDTQRQPFADAARSALAMQEGSHELT